MDYKKKYLKYKMKYLELKQKGGFNPELISQIPRYPELPLDFIRYVFNQLKKINEVLSGKPPGVDPLVDMYRGIRTGGSGSFTNKISSDGFIKLGYTAQIELKKNVELFYNFAEQINYVHEPFVGGDSIRVYRSVEFKNGKVPKPINQPIPFSCTWDIHFPVYEWGGLHGTKQVLEIIINKETNFLPLSFPGNMEELPPEFLLNNQEQLEVALPPGNLEFVDERIERFKSKIEDTIHNVPIYTYKLYPYPQKGDGNYLEYINNIIKKK